ncbi:MAG TPA: ComEC/Rec2 family competence protein [Acidimicrobiia bacterium]
MTGRERTAVAAFDPGPLIAAFGAVVGVLLGERAGPSAAPFLLGSGVVAILAAIAVRGPRRIALATVGIAALACACTQRSLNGEARSPLAALANRAPIVTVTGTLVSDPVGPAYLTSVLLRVDHVSVDGTQRHVDGRVLVRATATDAGEWRVPGEGDGVTATGLLRPLVGRDRDQRWRHAVALLADARLSRVASPRAPPFVVANRVREIVLRGCESLDPVDRALLAGFLLGDVRGVPATISAEFRASGLTHLLAVSGENVAFVLALVGPLLRRCSLRGRLLVGATVLVVFGCATRFEPSVLRAEVMAAFAMAATFVGRPAPAGRLLCGAVIALLVADPFLLHSLGFQLSVAATGAIVALAPRLANRLPGPRWLREPLAVSFAAQLGVTPVLLAMQGSVPLVSPLANLVAVPLAEPLTVAGFALTSFAGLVGDRVPRLAGLGFAPLGAMLGWVRLVAHLGAEVPLVLHLRGALALLASAAALVAIRRGRGGSLRADAPARSAVPDDSPR